MPRIDLEDCSSEEVAKIFGRTKEDFPLVILEVMNRIVGAELVYCIAGNECDTVYHISPEEVTCYISLDKITGTVGRSLFGREKSLEPAATRVRKAFSNRINHFI